MSGIETLALAVVLTSLGMDPNEATDEALAVKHHVETEADESAKYKPAE